MNWYAYVGNRPTMGVDPEGLDGPIGPVVPPRRVPCPHKPKPKDPCKEACYRQFQSDKSFCNLQALLETGICTAAFALCVEGTGGVATPACVWGYRLCLSAVLGHHALCLAQARADLKLCLERCKSK